MTAATIKSRLDDAEVVSIWTAPDMSILNLGRRAAVPMPKDIFGAAWDTVLEVAEVTSTEPDYAGLAYLACCASLIGGKRRIRPHATSNWTEPPILWCVALGDPSSRKSSPLEMMTRPLWAIQQDAQEDHKEALRSWNAEVERSKAEKIIWQEGIKKASKAGGQTPSMPVLAVEPDRPAERRTIIADVTPEAAAMVLSGNPQGVLAYNDELAGWLESFDRYTTGGRPFWLSAYGGRPYNVTRKGAGSIHCDFLGISVLGSLQPDRLAPLLTDANDGLIPRLLWAWPAKMQPTIPKRPADLSHLETVYRRLESLAWGTDGEGKAVAQVIPLAPDAAAAFHAWDVANAGSIGEDCSLYGTFVGKASGTALRLALVSELSGWAFAGGAEPDAVSLRSLAAAIDWTEAFAKPTAQRVFGDAAVPVEDRNAALLAKHIVAHRMEVVNMRQMRQHPHRAELKALQKDGAMEAAFAALQLADWLRAAPNREGDTTGQPRKDFRVNPAVHGRAK